MFFSSSTTRIVVPISLPATVLRQNVRHDEPLVEQVEAVAAWCQGFLNGVGSTAPAAARSSADGTALGEILRDFAEISRAGLSEEEAEGHDEPDFALAEIQEYVRVSVQIVFEELGPLRAAAAPEVH
jgi:hypothetical protein